MSHSTERRAMARGTGPFFRRAALLGAALVGAGCSSGASPSAGAGVAEAHPSVGPSDEGPGAREGGPHEAPIAAASAPPPAAKRVGPLDVTFAVVSDTHFGHAGNEEKNRALVAALGALPTLRYPGHKEVVGPVRGLLVAGDLTEWGNASEWETFRAVYGLGGGEKPGSPVPVFEVVGNHDMVHVRGS